MGSFKDINPDHLILLIEPYIDIRDNFLKPVLRQPEYVAQNPLV